MLHLLGQMYKNNSLSLSVQVQEQQTMQKDRVTNTAKLIIVVITP